MELKDSHIWIALFVLLLVLGWSLYSIFHFMPIANKCAPSFKVINTCGCIPDNNLATLFKYNQTYYPTNNSGVLNAN